MIIPDKFGKIYQIFKNMMIKHPLAEKAFVLFDELRDGKEGAPNFFEQRGGFLLAPSQAGKSKTVEMYIRKHVISDCVERGLLPSGLHDHVAFGMQRLVIHITLSSPSTVGSLMSDLLKKLGDPAPERGTVAQRRDRVFQLLEAHGTELLIIDEIQHLSTQIPDDWSKRAENASSVHNNLKKLMQAGFPCVFIGRPEAREKIFTEEQVILRVEDEIDFSPLADSELKPAGIPINYRPPFRFEAGQDSNQLPAGSRL